MSNPSPELPLSSAQTQPSYEHVIENEEGEESGDSVFETNIGHFISEDALNILEKINSIMNVNVNFESSGDVELSKVEKAIYNEEYGDEEFKASMDIVQLPVATILARVRNLRKNLQNTQKPTKTFKTQQKIHKNPQTTKEPQKT
jgi:hypothetical protein